MRISGDGAVYHPVGRPSGLRLRCNGPTSSSPSNTRDFLRAAFCSSDSSGAAALKDAFRCTGLVIRVGLWTVSKPPYFGPAWWLLFEQKQFPKLFSAPECACKLLT